MNYSGNRRNNMLLMSASLKAPKIYIFSIYLLNHSPNEECTLYVYDGFTDGPVTWNLGRKNAIRFFYSLVFRSTRNIEQIFFCYCLLVWPKTKPIPCQFHHHHTILLWPNLCSAANHMFDDYRISVTWPNSASIEISLQYSNLVKQTIRSKFRYSVFRLPLFFLRKTTISTRLNGSTQEREREFYFVCSVTHGLCIYL